MAGATRPSRQGAGLGERVAEVVTRGVAAGDVPGAAWWVAGGDDVVRGEAGTHGPGSDGPIRPDTVFRLSSTTKPIVAAAAMTLVDDGALDLDAPVDDVLPELADRRVLVDPTDPRGVTVPARRPITARDLLDFRLGLGMDFTGPWPSPFLAAMADAGLPPGPPAPQAQPEPDGWMRRVGTLPLAHQPGERWLYHTGASVLGVLLARVSGRPLPELLQERILSPLGMTSTGFGVPERARARLGPHWAPAEEGGLRLYDPADGQWSRRPAFPDAGDGLVSTVEDLAAFAAMLQAGGVAPVGAGSRPQRGSGDSGPGRILSEGTVRERCSRSASARSTTRVVAGGSASECAAWTSRAGVTPGPSGGTAAWAAPGGPTRCRG